MALSPTDFATFFQAIHNCAPFPWQQALVDRLATSDEWPDVLELPTGSGKTASLDAAVFHLALRADAPGKAALRIALVVDRRLVVDAALARAEKIRDVLYKSINERFDGEAIVKEVARRLCRLAGEGNPPLITQRLRGGAPLELDWARTPTQPSILCSTVDQVGSRLLFRGYGVSDRMKPVHAGLLGTNTLILMDEAHLAEPFRQTLDAVCKIGQAKIRVALLSATLAGKAKRPFFLSPEDRANITLKKRLGAQKLATLKPPIRSGSNAAKAFAEEARKIAGRLRNQGVSPVAVAVVVNRVALARDVFSELSGDDVTDVVLMIGRSRDVNRDAIASKLAPFHTDAGNRKDAKPLFVVATQCLEVGVDLDLDGLVTQAAPLDSLRQRFGRLNRAGRPISAEGAIIALAENISKKANDPVYGDRIRLTWDALDKIHKDHKIDFGVEASFECLQDAGIDLDGLVSKPLDAPVVMPAYLDLWSQTSPRPTADPDVALFLHGVERAAAVISIVWRSDISEADLTGETGVNLKDITRLVPPRSAESIELTIGVARAWLCRSDHVKGQDLSDAPERATEAQEETLSRRASPRKAFRWAGYDDPGTSIVLPEELRPGDLLVVPSEYGGCDEFGWVPISKTPVMDVADKAAKPYWEGRCATRIARDVVCTEDQWKEIQKVLASENEAVSEIVNQLFSKLSSGATENKGKDELLPRDTLESLGALRRAKGRVELHFPYAGGRTGGAILVAEQGVGQPAKPQQFKPYISIPATEDETASHTSTSPVYLDEHGDRVARFAKEFANSLGLEDVAQDIALAGYLHDAGKADPRFQTMLAGGDIWNRPDGPPLAKSGRSVSPKTRELAALPRGWRHEALSVRMAQEHPKFNSARDPALVLWLIGSHHGLGRPFFDFLDPDPEQPLPCLDVTEWRLSKESLGPQTLAFDFNGCDWPALFEGLKRRYGVWGLAHLEAVLRLADHQASEEERICAPR